MSVSSPNAARTIRCRRSTQHSSSMSIPSVTSRPVLTTSHVGTRSSSSDEVSQVSVLRRSGRTSASVKPPTHGLAETASSSTSAVPLSLNTRSKPTGMASSSRRKRTGAGTCKPLKSPPTKRSRMSFSIKAPPNAKNDLDYVDRSLDTSSPEKTVSCPICMSEPDSNEISTINGCAHRFCFSCIAKWGDRENTCPLCKARFTVITRVNPRRVGARAQSGGRTPNKKTVKQRDQRNDLISGTIIEGLLQSWETMAGNRIPLLDPVMRRFLTSELMGLAPMEAFQGPVMADFFQSSEGEESDDDYNDFAFIPSNPIRFISNPALSVRSTPRVAATTPIIRSMPRLPTTSETVRSIPRTSTFINRPTNSRVARSTIPRVERMTAVDLEGRPLSFASNSEDIDAGCDRSNPLEIVDDDDSVEFVSVRPPTYFRVP